MKKSIHDTQSQIQDRAILVSMLLKSDRHANAMADQSLEELVRLAETAGTTVLTKVTQSKDHVDSTWFIGKGKVDEVKALVDELEATTVIFDQELSGAQVRNLEQALDAKIIDRTQLILDIFAQRAKTREGQLQVELAQLSYLLPRLSGHGKNLSRLGGGIGTRGPGETKLETDRRHIRKRISELKAALTELTRTRQLHRDRRRKTGVFQVALVGYTNAGKSTLLNRLTDAGVLEEDKLFATLDPTSRNLKLMNGKEIILTDTVGFIQNLPHDLVAAFRATLEEVNEADLILHVVDASSDMRDEQIRVVHDVLYELGAQGKERFMVYNKIDLCDPAELQLLGNDGDSLKISAISEADLWKLKEVIQRKLMGDTKMFRIPAERGDLASLLYRVGEVMEQDSDGDDMLYRVRLKKQEYEQMGHMLASFESSGSSLEHQ
jgi:GTPase